MSKVSIITLPNPHLRQKSVKVNEITPEIIELVDEMTKLALAWEDSRPHEISAAIAAAQVDRPERLIIVRSDLEDKANREFTALINPQIIKFEGGTSKDYEGCLSVPDIYGKVSRYNKIRVKAIDIDGNEIRFKARDFLARVIQHEIDHINGIVFIDHIRDDTQAFFELDEQGELQPLNYDEKIKNNSILWD